MAKASDNLFPYVHLTPAAAPASPAAGAQRLYLDSADGNKLKRKDSSGTVTTIEGGPGSGGGDASWTAPTMVNGWVNYDATTGTQAGYRKDAEGRVWLRGLIKSGTVSAVIFTLPAGYRPVAQQAFSVPIAGAGAAAFGIIQVKADGTVNGLYNSATYTYLDGVVFYTT